MEHESEGVIGAIVISELGTVTKRLLQRLEDLGNKRTSGDHPNYKIIEIGQNTKKSPGDLGVSSWCNG